MSLFKNPQKDSKILVILLNYTKSIDSKKIPLVLIMGKSLEIMSEERKMYPIKCSDCGTDSEVPFEPAADRPVYCKECLTKHRSDGPKT